MLSSLGFEALLTGIGRGERKDEGDERRRYKCLVLFSLQAANKFFTVVEKTVEK